MTTDDGNRQASRTLRNAIARALLAQPDAPGSHRRALEVATATIVAAGEWDTADKVRRLQAGRRAKQANGGWHAGTPPYGYRSQGHGSLTAVPAELEVAAWIVRQREQGFGWQKIADALNSAGTRGPSGGAWHQSTVRRIVARGRDYVPLAAVADEGNR